MPGVRRRGLLSAAVLAAALLLPAAAQAAAGDVFVADESAEVGADDGAIFTLPPSGTSVTVLSDSSALVAPSGMVLDRKGDLITADYAGIKRVDRETGAVSTIAPASAFDEALDVALGPDGKLYVSEYESGGSDAPSRLLRVDPKTGAVTTLASEAGEWDEGGGVAVRRNGIVYFTDYGDEVFELDPKTGVVSTLVESELLDGADGLLLSPDERFLYVAAFSSIPDNNLVRVNLKTGEATKFAGFEDIVALALLPSGDFLTSDTDDGFGAGFEGIQRVGRTGSPITTFSGDPDFDYPHDIVVEPKKCKGKFPTVVGTDRREKIKGSKFADVISTLGGKDKVNAGKGNDLVCGGKGKDKLKGGKGKDKLRGEKGKDTCIGNGGKDKAVGCEAGKV